MLLISDLCLLLAKIVCGIGLLSPILDLLTYSVVARFSLSQFGVASIPLPLEFRRIIGMALTDVVVLDPDGVERIGNTSDEIICKFFVFDSLSFEC